MFDRFAYVAIHLDCCHRFVLYCCVIVSCCDLVFVVGLRLLGHNCQLEFGDSCSVYWFVCLCSFGYDILSFFASLLSVVSFCES